MTDVQALDTLETHLSDNLLVDERRFGAADSRGVEVSFLDQGLVGELKLLGEGLVEPKPSLVSLRLRGLVQIVESRQNNVSQRSCLCRYIDRVWRNGQALVDFQEELLALSEDDHSSTFVAGASCTADTMYVLISARRKSDLEDMRYVWKVHATANHLDETFDQYAQRPEDDGTTYITREHDAGRCSLEVICGSSSDGLREARLQLRNLHDLVAGK